MNKKIEQVLNPVYRESEETTGIKENKIPVITQRKLHVPHYACEPLQSI